MYGIKVKDTGSASYVIVPAQVGANETETMNKAFSIVKLAMTACGRTCYDWDADENGVMTVNFYDDSDKVAKMELSIVNF